MSADVGRWLDALGLGKYAARFDEHEVDLAALPGLTDADPGEPGLPLGPVRRTLRAAAGHPGTHSRRVPAADP